MANDHKVNSYSPEGRIYQIEYAMKAMNHGVTTVALATTQSVVISSEKKILSKLQVTSSATKHFKIDDRIGLAFSGD
ncbi:20S proteasome, regulatory subunit alpha type PSMA5/PUP2 [Trachipleistophora hominis]|uniref:Proteasome subunit alpha type n=1 Tax=Trachipleistophora hominis TaxID=72359 RepID=L7JUK8_TRAHO|nr:20S proteasome, regulatory subunit alpha type PSMA5/PUP2 [Trachipleistophora hominis]